MTNGGNHGDPPTYQFYGVRCPWITMHAIDPDDRTAEMGASEVLDRAGTTEDVG